MSYKERLIIVDQLKQISDAHRQAMGKSKVVRKGDIER